MASDGGQSGSDMSAIRASKRTLRQSITKALRSLTSDAINEQSANAVKALLSMKEYQRANRISVYLSIEGKEIQTARVIEHALRAKKQVFVPYVHDDARQTGEMDSVMDMLALRSLEDLQGFKRDRWGIPTIPSGTVLERENCFGGLGVPSEEEVEVGEAVGLDLIVVPGMAFDRSLGRLGHGKGYYDRFLSRCKEQADLGRADGMPFLVALALDVQVLSAGEQVPKSESDWLVDRLATSSGEVW